MKNKLFCHLIIDLCIACSLLYFDELRKKRKEIKRITKKLDKVHSGIQGIEFDVEILEQNFKELSDSLKSKSVDI